MNEETISKPRLAYLIQVADAAARDDESSASTRSEMRHVAAALRELEQHRVAREADTWPMCDADAERMEKAAEALERRTAHRDELGQIVMTWLAYLDQSGVDVEAERHPDNPSLNPVKALCERSRAALARQS